MLLSDSPNVRVLTDDSDASDLDALAPHDDLDSHPSAGWFLGMTVTPDELRNAELREAVRGYHRRAVDDLCERAAETIEILQRRHRELAERLARGGGERRAPSDVDPDVIQRTLVLAQRTADEVVAEATTRAEAMVGEAEARASSLVTDAEETARRVREAEHARLESEIGELCAVRDALTTDVDALEQFAASYRDRIRRLIEAELVRIGVSVGDLQPSVPRPQLSTGPAELRTDPPMSSVSALRSALEGTLGTGDMTLGVGDT